MTEPESTPTPSTTAESPTRTPPDPIDEVVRSDHAAILAAAVALRTNSDPAATADLFSGLCADVVRHFVAEEQYLLPAVRDRLDGGRQLSDEAFAEHEHIEHLLKDLDDDDTTDERLAAALTAVESALREHVSAQESTVLPALVAALDRAELDRLGEGMLGAEQLAPTHPRTIVVRSVTLSKLTSWLTGLVEKGLDAR